MKMTQSRLGLGVMAAAAALTVLGSGAAGAQTVTGWTGSTGQSEDGIIYLDNSAIINSPNLTAQSTIYPSFGQSVSAGTIGVRSRLFKSGVLCEAIDYRYNTKSVTSFTAGTTQTCGTGSYNSHGFVSVYNSSSGYQEYLTFPSNPLNWTAPAARSAQAPDSAQATEGTNSAGQRYGSGDTATSDATLPDLVQAYATNGKVGFVKKSDLKGKVAANPSEAAKTTASTRTVNVVKSDGVTVIGQFKIG